MDATIYALAGTYLAEPHLRGREVTVTIEKVEVHEFEKQDPKTKKTRKVKKPVLYFKGKDIPLGLTAKVNLLAVIDAHGREMDDWIGKQLTLYPTTCLAFGNPKTPCIRIRTTKK